MMRAFCVILLFWGHATAADPLSDRELDIRGDFKEGIAGAAALGAIDFIETRPQIGVALSNYGGDIGFAVKGMLPINRNIHATIGVFGGENNSSGYAASIVFKF